MRTEPWHFDGKDSYGPLGSIRLGLLVFMNYDSSSHVQRDEPLWKPMSRLWLPVLLPLGLGVSFSLYSEEKVLFEIEHVLVERFHLRGPAARQRLQEFSAALVIQQSDVCMARWMNDQVDPNLSGGDAGSAACLASFATSMEIAKAIPTTHLGPTLPLSCTGRA